MLHRLPEAEVDAERERSDKLRKSHVRTVQIGAHRRSLRRLRGAGESSKRPGTTVWIIDAGVVVDVGMHLFGPPARAGSMRIAIVGAGVSGLVCAHLLHRRHDITVFEANDRAGGHTNTCAWTRPTRRTTWTPGFIVHNDRNYPGFLRLLRELGVATQPSEMSFSVSDGARLRVQRRLPERAVRMPRAPRQPRRSTGWCATWCASTARRRR